MRMPKSEPIEKDRIVSPTIPCLSVWLGDIFPPEGLTWLEVFGSLPRAEGYNGGYGIIWRKRSYFSILTERC